MDRRLGGPLPHQLPNPTRAHPCAINLWHQKHAYPMHYAVLASVSRRCPPHKGRLLTRYSPVRHWSAPKSFTVRLECVMHAASVHPEPGSNSQTNCISSAVAVRFLSELFSLASFTFFKSSIFSWFWQILYSHLLKFALYLFHLLFSCQVSIALPLIARACLLYHPFPTLSIGFAKIFQKNFRKIFLVCGYKIYNKKCLDYSCVMR